MKKNEENSKQDVVNIGNSRRRDFVKYGIAGTVSLAVCGGMNELIGGEQMARVRHPNKKVVRFKTDRTEKIVEAGVDEYLPEIEKEWFIHFEAEKLQDKINQKYPDLEEVEVAVLFNPGCVWFGGKIYC